MCGHWGICSSTSFIGAALSIIHQIGGDRYCKRNAFLSISEAVKFIKRKYNIQMTLEDTYCEFSNLNKQCISLKCPYYKQK